MRAVVQRVSQAHVEVDGRETGRIGRGLLVLLGVGQDDGREDVRYLAEKIAYLRIFPDSGDKMNLSVQEVGGGVLVVSQFTLYGDTTRGRRPGFDQAAKPEHAKRLYEHFVTQARAQGIPTETGIFQASMSVHLVNEGPVTFIVESKSRV